jgi:nucleotide-binding universal stress UspA family protein
MPATKAPRATALSDLLVPLTPVQPPRGPLLVASDASAASDATFPLARVLALRTGAPVQVVSAIQPNAMPTYAFDAMPMPAVPSPELIDQRTTQVHAQLARLVPDIAERALWPVVVRSGEPIREIVQRAHDLEARLIVVGRGRHGLLERAVGGESVLRLLQLGETPVLAVEHTLERLPRRVVIATDFSAFSVYAAQVALDLCAPDATVELVHVAPNLTEHAPVLREFAAEYRAQATASFAAMMDRLRQAEITFETTLLEGNASSRLIQHLAVNPADLVVTATHGYGFLLRMMLGSVAAELVRSAPCSVLCVPGSARTLAAARARATALHDSVHPLALEELDRHLAAFTAHHRGHPCTVEVNRRDIGAHSIGHHLRLAGMSYEAAGRTITMMFGPSAEPGQHLAHQVHGCEQVEIVVDAAGREQVLRVHHDGGVTVLLLE